VALPHAAVRELVAGAIDLVVHQRREPDGSRRIVAVSEVVRAAGTVATRELFALRDGRAVWRAPLPAGLAARLAQAAVAAPAAESDEMRSDALPTDSLARLEAARRRLRASVVPRDAPA
jgi:hypothetical protein